MRKGTPVIFTTDRLGIMADKYAYHFDADTVGRGDTGTYDEPSKLIPEDNWHWVRLDDGRVVPVHGSQFDLDHTALLQGR